MESTPNDLCPPVSAPSPGTFRLQKLAIWLPCCAALGLLIAWAAMVARGYVAPMVLFPLIVGVVLGGAAVLAMRVLDVGHRRTIWLGALLAGLLTVGGQHYFTFWKTQQRFAADPDKLAKLHLVAPERIPPTRFWDFMTWSAAQGLPIGGYSARGGWAWLVWSIDGLLVLVPAVVLAGATARLPYCNRCRQWYHTTRSGGIDSRTAAEIGALVETGLNAEIVKGRYRLIVCQGGCGPTALAIAGEDAGGRLCSAVVWLNATRRQRVVEILDRLNRSNAEEDVPKTET